MVVASGSVKVVADVPVNTSILSDEPAVVLAENEVYFVESDPRTSNVELGLVVPIPICAFADTASVIKKMVNSLFIGRLLDLDILATK